MNAISRQVYRTTEVWTRAWQRRSPNLNGKMDKSPPLTRADLRNYAPASNLQLNEEIKRMISEGKNIYHFGFGQSPFPVMKEFCQKLSQYAGANQYLAVTGKEYLA
ncbi:uncharacterized protein TRIADDRAFT_60599 [Trichoplax adhaerens]|uniref:Aminotransferase class I/classII domain-containing protein n=1 Tax=Trichoplax adhaerens TaxID=10228 RepID=B3S8N2_TRIAD|nr:hypothetical protein TRIADDRAFT_60599 [Trichoplax adhaerens]EDV20913.1 hypothetical protein TRIADDRAFT_60599 [Trichoplax adhaerens]|eukprot:XP_002116557.1 hypothetical protein TRIADDRAFT_60599 [Trichoplax adhaerens]